MCALLLDDDTLDGSRVLRSPQKFLRSSQTTRQQRRLRSRGSRCRPLARRALQRASKVAAARPKARRQSSKTFSTAPPRYSWPIGLQASNAHIRVCRAVSRQAKRNGLLRLDQRSEKLDLVKPRRNSTRRIRCSSSRMPRRDRLAACTQFQNNNELINRTRRRLVQREYDDQESKRRSRRLDDHFATEIASRIASEGWRVESLTFDWRDNRRRPTRRIFTAKTTKTAAISLTRPPSSVTSNTTTVCSRRAGECERAQRLLTLAHSDCLSSSSIVVCNFRSAPPVARRTTRRSCVRSPLRPTPTISSCRQSRLATATKKRSTEAQEAVCIKEAKVILASRRLVASKRDLRGARRERISRLATIGSKRGERRLQAGRQSASNSGRRWAARRARCAREQREKQLAFPRGVRRHVSELHRERRSYSKFNSTVRSQTS